VALITRSRAHLLHSALGSPAEGGETDSEKAARFARDALATDPSDPVAWACLGHAVYACEGDDPSYTERLAAAAADANAAPAKGARRGPGSGLAATGGASGKSGRGGARHHGGGGGHHDQNLPDPAVCGSLACYEAAFALTVENDLVDPVAWVRLGWLRPEPSKSRDAHFRACAEWPCATSWLGVGESYLTEASRARVAQGDGGGHGGHGGQGGGGSTQHQNELVDLAEEALAEANVLDPRNPSVWLALALACLHSSRADEARRCVLHATRCGADDAVLLQRVGRAMVDTGNAADAEAVMRAAIAAGGGAQARLDLAEVLVELGRLDEAVPELRSVVERGDWAVRRPAIRSLCAVLVSLERGAEAERYRAMLAEEEGEDEDDDQL
jgi:tetratricopeptide (TPR) repeat protein